MSKCLKSDHGSLVDNILDHVIETNSFLFIVALSNDVFPKIRRGVKTRKLEDHKMLRKLNIYVLMHDACVCVSM